MAWGQRRAEASMGMSEYVRRMRARIGTDVLLLPSATIALFDDAGRLLVGRAADSGRWVTIGGAIDPGETPANAAIREAREEAGLDVAIRRLIGVFSGPEFLVTYGNGDRTHYVVSMFEAHTTGGTPAADGHELSELAYVSQAEATVLPAAPITRVLMERAFKRDRQFD
jgi:8-oxo-dGTP pyrophosphatase MutT (NUDIX family)